jgi:8-oxo-dGTP pyrophosphatase MutT (NUDIX family)
MGELHTMGNYNDNYKGMSVQNIIDKTNNTLAYKKVNRPESVGCGVILLDHSGKIILGTRTDYPEEVLKRILDSGEELKWTNAGGGMEERESPIYCIMRELKEEFGIEAGKQTTHLEVVGYSDNYYLKNKWVRCKRDYVFITSLKHGTSIDDIVPQKGEIGIVKAFTKNEVIDMIIEDKIYKATKNSILMAIKLGYL